MASGKPLRLRAADHLLRDVRHRRSGHAACRRADGVTRMVKTVRTPTLEIAYQESGPADGVPVILLHGWPSDPHDWDGVAPPLAAERMPRAGAVAARLWPDAVPRRCDAAIGPAGGARCRCARLHGCAWHRAGAARRLRLGWSRRLRDRSLMAGARAWAGVDQRLQHPEHSRARANRRRRRRNIATGTSGISTPNAAAPGCSRTAATSPVCCGSSGRRTGSSTTRRSTRRRRASTIPTSSM